MEAKAANSWLKTTETSESKIEKTTARFIAETLKGYGITHVFYVDAILRRALVEMESLGIHKILTHSEKAAAYMADGFSRVSRGPSVCMAQSVGAANLAAGLQDSYLGHSSVLAITGRKPPLFQYRNAYQEINHDPMFESVTKYHANISDPKQLSFLLRQALRETTSGKPGPAHLDVFGNLGDEISMVKGDFRTIIEEPFKQSPPLRIRPEQKSVVAVAELLREAKRPVIVAGGGVKASGAETEIVKLAELLSIPVATSVTGKGSIVETHPLSVGAVGSYSRWCANRVVSEADVVLFVGSQTGDQVSCDWRIPPMGTSVIQIDIDPSELGRNYPNTVGLLGDARETVGMIIECFDGTVERPQWINRIQELVRDWQEELAPLRNSDAMPIRPERLCKEITDCLPQNAILVADTGHAAIWTGTMVYITNSKQTYMRAAGSLGWGFPAALGAKCAAPERPVVCFTGDAGFWYHLSELETALRYGIKTVTIVNNNYGIGQCVPGIKAAYGETEGKKEEMYQFSDVSFAKIANEIGCLGIRVDRPEEIAGAINQALESSLPAVVEVITDMNCVSPKPWIPPIA